MCLRCFPATSQISMTSIRQRCANGSSTAFHVACGRTPRAERPSRPRRYGCRPGGSACLDAQVDDLVAYVRALAAAEVPEDPAARKGHAVAERLGCFRCHGPGGRGAGSNPGSLKGYIPPWDGRDFAELVVNERELREWILDGRPQRLQANPLARFFLDRQAIRMPAFRGHVTEEELRALEAYIGGLRLKARERGTK